MIFFFLCLTYLTWYDNPRSIHVDANDVVSFFFMTE